VELWADDDDDAVMIGVEVKGRDAKFIQELLGICRAAVENMRAIE
jgi:hypothetical protein